MKHAISGVIHLGILLVIQRIFSYEIAMLYAMAFLSIVVARNRVEKYEVHPIARMMRGNKANILETEDPAERVMNEIKKEE